VRTASALRQRNLQARADGSRRRQRGVPDGPGQNRRGSRVSTTEGWAGWPHASRGLLLYVVRGLFDPAWDTKRVKTLRVTSCRSCWHAWRSAWYSFGALSGHQRLIRHRGVTPLITSMAQGGGAAFAHGLGIVPQRAEIAAEANGRSACVTAICGEANKSAVLNLTTTAGRYTCER
jgi:hypothetical protein